MRLRKLLAAGFREEYPRAHRVVTIAFALALAITPVVFVWMTELVWGIGWVATPRDVVFYTTRLPGTAVYHLWMYALFATNWAAAAYIALLAEQ